METSLDTGRGLNTASASSCIETFRTRVEQGVVLVEMAVDGTKAEGARTEDLSVVCVEHRTLDATSQSSPAP